MQLRSLPRSCSPLFRPASKYLHSSVRFSSSAARTASRQGLGKHGDQALGQSEIGGRGNFSSSERRQALLQASNQVEHLVQRSATPSQDGLRLLALLEKREDQRRQRHENHSAWEDFPANAKVLWGACRLLRGGDKHVKGGRVRKEVAQGCTQVVAPLWASYLSCLENTSSRKSSGFSLPCSHKGEVFQGLLHLLSAVGYSGSASLLGRVSELLIVFFGFEPTFSLSVRSPSLPKEQVCEQLLPLAELQPKDLQLVFRSLALSHDRHTEDCTGPLRRLINILNAYAAATLDRTDGGGLGTSTSGREARDELLIHKMLSLKMERSAANPGRIGLPSPNIEELLDILRASFRVGVLPAEVLLRVFSEKLADERLRGRLLMSVRHYGEMKMTRGLFDLLGSIHRCVPLNPMRRTSTSGGARLEDLKLELLTIVRLLNLKWVDPSRLTELAEHTSERLSCEECTEFEEAPCPGSVHAELIRAIKHSPVVLMNDCGSQDKYVGLDPTLVELWVAASPELSCRELVDSLHNLSTRGTHEELENAASLLLLEKLRIIPLPQPLSRAGVSERDQSLFVMAAGRLLQKRMPSSPLYRAAQEVCRRFPEQVLSSFHVFDLCGIMWGSARLCLHCESGGVVFSPEEVSEAGLHELSKRFFEGVGPEHAVQLLPAALRLEGSLQRKREGAVLADWRRERAARSLKFFDMHINKKVFRICEPYQKKILARFSGRHKAKS